MTSVDFESLSVAQSPCGRSLLVFFVLARAAFSWNS